MVFNISIDGPIGKLTPQSWLMAPETKSVIAALTSEGAEVRFIGGCVRDSLLKLSAKEKNYRSDLKKQDIDIATPESPETVARLLKSAGIKFYDTAKKYGTISALIKGTKFEITTLRRDVKTDGRHASVVYTNDWIIDAKRRDFTFNALSVTPEGDLYDSFDGLNDLSCGQVRFIGVADERLSEDILRLLRFFRFFGLYGQPPADKNALEACKRHSKNLSRLSGERIWNEMSKILLTPKYGDVADLMNITGVYRNILPEAKNIKRLQMMQWLETNCYGKVKIKPDAVLRLAALIETNQRGAVNLSKRWKLSNCESSRLVTMVVPELSINPEINAIDLKRSLYKHGSKIISDLTILAWSEELTNITQPKNIRTEGWLNILEKCEKWRDIQFPLNGDDVIALGIKEGPNIGKLLNRVRKIWEKDGYIDGRKSCLKHLDSIAKDLYT